MKLILGSQSESRRLALSQAGYEFTIMPADIDEKAIRDTDYERLPLLIARAKAIALLPRILEDVILITADQVVVCNGELREKPESVQQAREYLESYAQYPAQTNSAVVVTNTKSGEQAEGVDIATVRFKPIPPDFIDRLIRDESILNSAGAFVIEHPILSQYIHYIDGTFDSVMGLPIEFTESLIGRVSSN